MYGLETSVGGLEECILEVGTVFSQSRKVSRPSALALGNLSALTKGLVKLQNVFLQSLPRRSSNCTYFRLLQSEYLVFWSELGTNNLGTSIYVLVPVLK